MNLQHVPRYSNGVALTLEEGTWYVVTDFSHPYGADIVSYPTYADAYKGWKLTAHMVTEVRDDTQQPHNGPRSA